MAGNGGPTGNVALLIDADNASPDSLDDVLTVLAELGTINIRRAYGNWSKPSLKGWAAMTHQHAIEPHQQFDVTKGKSATDMKMIIDAMDLLYRGRVTGFGIMSSDSDFMPITMRLRQDGLPVYGFGTAKTPEGFKKACTRFIDVSALKSDVAAGPDQQLVDLLGEAVKSAKRDERGFAMLSEVGRLVGNRSEFDTRNYGHKTLADLIQALPNFTTERREGGAVYVRRTR